MAAAGSLKCPKGHTPQVTDGGFSCDVCKKGGHKGDHWKCRQCNYDFCVACAPLTPPVAATPPAPSAVTSSASAPNIGASISVGAAAAQALDTLPVPYKCLVSHVMEIHSNGYGCDRPGCKERGTGEHFRCAKCNFDYCTKCAPVTAAAREAIAPKPAVPTAAPAIIAAVANPASTTASQVAPPAAAQAQPSAPSPVSIPSSSIVSAADLPLPYKCRASHVMGLLSSGYGCDRAGCSERGSGEHFRCSKCNFDYCTKCAPVTAAARDAVKPAAPSTMASSIASSPLFKQMNPEPEQPAAPARKKWATVEVSNDRAAKLAEAAHAKCKSGHPCFVAFCSGTCADCSAAIQSAHWTCPSCSYHLCGKCRSPPQDVVVAAKSMAELAEALAARGGPDCTCEDLGDFVRQYEQINKHLEWVPAGCIDAEVLTKFRVDRREFFVRFKKACVTEIKRMYNALPEREQYDTTRLYMVGSQIEHKLLKELAAGSAEAREIAQWREDIIAAAPKLAEKKRAEMEAAEKNILRSLWLKPYEAGGTVTVGDDQWIYKREAPAGEEPYASFVHTKRPELNFIWLMYWTGRNWVMKCKSEHGNMFGELCCEPWGAPNEWRLGYSVYAATFTAEWLKLTWHMGSDTLVSDNAVQPSWRINADGGVSALRETKEVPVGVATVSGKVPWQCCIFAAACYPQMGKIPEWADEACRLAQKQLDKERRRNGW